MYACMYITLLSLANIYRYPGDINGHHCRNMHILAPQDIIHSNRFFKSVKRNTTEKRKAAKVGRLIEILEEQLKPTLSVFIAGGIDAMFNI